MEEALRPAASRGEGGGGAKRRADQLEAENARLRHENEQLRQQRDILKNFGYPLRTPGQRFARIDTMKTEHPIRDLCQAFEVSPSGYYDWVKRQTQPSPRARQDAHLARQILQIHQESRQTYGSPRIQEVLSKTGRSHGRNRIARLMRQQDLCGRPQRRFRVCTTDSHHDQPVAPNRLAQLPPPNAPNRVWVGDITYIPTQEGWLYLAGIMDFYSRRLVGWAMEPALDTPLVLAAWNMACTHRQPPPALVFHSDRGGQYASAAFRQALAQNHALPSMTRKACCYIPAHK